MKLKLIDKRQETPNVWTFVFEPERPLKWQAGQYLIYSLPHEKQDSRGAMRFFSLASAPQEKNAWITMRFSGTNDSSFKRALMALPIGTELNADGPSGGFTVGPKDQELVFIAGGIGITAIRSILTDLDQRNRPLKGCLLYANRDGNFAYERDLEAIAERNPDFKIYYFITPDRITPEAISRLTQDLAEPVYYVSGPEPMVEAMERDLKAIKVAGSRIKRDYFPGYDWP